MKIIVVDNYDSFTFNLVYMIKKLGYGSQMKVVRNDKITVEEVGIYDLILLSPGPGVPRDAGIMPELIKKYSSTKNILGVCLGHQAIAEAYGSVLLNLDLVVHGESTAIEIIHEDLLFKGLPSHFQVGRYHSWVIDPNQISNELQITAWSKDQQIMAIKHQQHEVRGVQFHPESILTENGYDLMQNWLKIY
jgi:anthranilate synthase component II